MQHRLGAVGAVTFVLASVVAWLAAPVTAHAATPVLVIDGKGFGHGVGLAQDGAYWMGRAGASTGQIIGQFYPGTAFGRTGQDDPIVRVAVLEAGAAPAGAAVTFPDGGAVYDAISGAQSPGFPVSVPPGGTVTLRWDGARYAVAAGPAARTAAAAGPVPAEAPPPTLIPPLPTLPPPTAPRPRPSPTTTSSPPPSGGQPAAPPASPGPPPPPAASSTRPLWAVPSAGGRVGQGTATVVARDRSYRGAVEAVAAGGSLRLVDQVGVEDYLKGMGEVLDPSWPPAALRAQAVVARTYALRAMSGAGELCDDQRCQVYLGAQAEYAAMNQAVDATRDTVVTAGGGYAATVYSANGGGYSASRQEGFGVDDGASYPYLRAAPYPTGDPGPWRVTVALADLASRLGYRGSISGISVQQRGPSGRALEISLAGSSGTAAVSGLSMAAALGLRSTLFDLHLGVADRAPPAPPPGSPLQVPPDQVGGLTPLSPAEAAAGGADPGPPGQPGTGGRRGRTAAGLPLGRSHSLGGLPAWAVVLDLSLLAVVIGVAASQARARRWAGAGGPGGSPPDQGARPS